MSMLQLNPPLRLYTPFGPGYAHILTIDGPESDQKWTVFLDDGRIVDLPNYKVRAQNNYTLGRINPGLQESLLEKRDHIGGRPSKPKRRRRR